MRCGPVLVRHPMVRSLSLALVVLCGCTREGERTTRAVKKPRVEIVVLSTSGERFGDAAWVSKLAAAWKGEAERCTLPDCALLKLSTATGAPAAGLGYEASVAAALDGGPTQLAANLPGAPEERFVEPGGVRLQVLGLSAGAGGAESALQRIAPEVYRRDARGTIVVSDLCGEVLESIVQHNAREWPFVLLTIGKPCARPALPRHIVATLVVSGGEGDGYDRSALLFDRNTGALLTGDARCVELR